MRGRHAQLKDTIRIWNVHTGKQDQVIDGIPDTIWMDTIAVLSDGRFVVVPVEGKLLVFGV